ncbi:MAG: hypothetical protein IIC81_09275, partial [Chloroflexi bacterium]|nr:hypothetical protein [Chloroflexota bacterium]
MKVLERLSGKGPDMKTRHLVIVLLLVVALVVTTTAGAFAAPLLQVEGTRVGLFGTVSTVLDGTIILDGGEIVATDENTRFLVPGVEGAGLGDIAVGDRLAILAVELEDGSLLALDVLSTPEEPVDNDHVIGVVTGTEDGLITITDDEGNEITIELPEGATAAIGDLLTVVSSPGKGADKRSAKAIAAIDDVIERLVDNIEDATEEAVERLKRLLEDNGDEKLTALANALEHAAEQAIEALEAALNTSQSDLDEVYKNAGVPGPSIKVKGFVTDLDVTGRVGTITIDSIDDGEVTLKITPATKIEDPIAVGDFVKAKYNPGLVAKKIELEPDELDFHGVIESFSETSLTLDGQTFVIDADTEIEGELAVGAEAWVEARPSSGSLIALEIEVEEGEEEEEDGDGGPKKIELKGTITAILSDTEIEVDGVPVSIAGAEIKGILAIGAKVKVEGTLDEGSVKAVEIKVKEVTEEEDDEGPKPDIEFTGYIDDLFDSTIVVNGLTISISGAEIKGTLSVGKKVKVEANSDLVATEITVEDEDDDDDDDE